MQVTFLILIIIRLTKMFEKEDNSERRKACFWLFKYLSSLSRIKRTVLFVVHESPGQQF